MGRKWNLCKLNLAVHLVTAELKEGCSCVALDWFIVQFIVQSGRVKSTSELSIFSLQFATVYSSCLKSASVVGDIRFISSAFLYETSCF